MSAAQADWEVMLDAKESMTFEQMIGFTAQEASRVWVMPVTDREAVKNELEF